MILAPTARGALWMVAASAAFAVQAAIVKHVGLRLDPFVIAFFNAAFGFVFLLPAVAREGCQVLMTKRPFMHLMRGLAGAGGLIGMVYSMVHLPLADATAIAFTKPLFGVLLAGFSWPSAWAGGAGSRPSWDSRASCSSCGRARPNWNSRISSR